jgi:hypothetical protein
MEPYHFTMLGLGLDIIGAFFVAVEAIKLENLRTLRERVFRNAYRYTLSPRIRFVDSEAVPNLDEDAERPSERYAGFFMGLHYVAGLIVLLVANHLFDGRVIAWLSQGGVWLWERPLYLGVPFLLLALVLGVVVGLWSLGEVVHMLMTGTTKSSVRFLEFVEARTPDGTVGMLGFLLLVAGFSLQFYGTYLSGHQ